MKRQPFPRLVGVVTLLLALAAAGPVRADEAGDRAQLVSLNEAYVKAFLAHDALMIRTMLTDDFEAVLADGRLIDRAAFLAQASIPPPVKSFEAHDPVVHLYGDSAVITLWVSYKHPDETSARTRYIELCVRQNGRWKMASIQWTRLAPLGR